ncbi:MAG TPA: hypothetical protein EYP49_00015, partial [Anaerolineae bacterium]|nr:hypothetical protein [Anaerolineae bacterium]
MRKVGLDSNRPVEGGTPSWRVHPPDFMASTGTGYVRINFVLDQWSSPADDGWLRVYDTIVNGLKEKGIEIYGLIGHESVREPPGDNFRNARKNAAADAWIDRYVENFVTIVGHFRDRVKIFESFNEPNDWHGGNKAWIHPYWFAKMLERIYRAVKLERGFTDVTLVSGPLLAHDLGGAENGISMATKYLKDTYQAGKKKHGWEDVRSSFGSYPLDGIGYHLYVRQSAESTPADIKGAHKKYLNALSKVVKQQDVADKKIYVSEFGWRSDHGEAFQARNLRAGFEYLREDPRVALAVYFCTQDFPEGEGIARWGLLKMNGEKKPAYNAFLEQARLDREAVVVTAVEPTPQEKIAQLEKEAQGLRQQLAASRATVSRLEKEGQELRQQLATSQTTTAQLQQEVQVLRQQVATLQETITQLRRQVDTLRQQLVAATTTTPVITPPVTPPAIAPPPMEDVTTRLRRHPVKRFDTRTLDQIKYL